MAAFETIIYEIHDGVAGVTLNRPSVLNAYNIRMRDELFEVLGAVEDDPGVRVAVFKGAGEKAFCAGADLTEFLSAPSPVIARRVRWERDVWGRFLGISKPLIAALHGYVLGSGIEICLCCDIRLASEDARFGLPEVALGIIPAAGGTQTLPRVVGASRALDVLLSGRRIDASEALAFRLVNRVLARADLYSEADRLAHRLASHDALALSLMKQAVTRGLDVPLCEGIDLEKRLGRVLVAAKR